jgi:hypothetical protein
LRAASAMKISAVIVSLSLRNWMLRCPFVERDDIVALAEDLFTKLVD